MVPDGNKAKRLSSVKHTTKTIHHHRHHQIFVSFFVSNSSTDNKLSKTQLSKIIQTGFLGRLLGPLSKTGLLNEKCN